MFYDNDDQDDDEHEDDPILEIAVIYGMINALRLHAWKRGFKVEAVVTRISTEKHVSPVIDEETPF
jgi:hypothetical protein